MSQKTVSTCQPAELTLTDANTEYSLTLPENTAIVRVQARTAVAVKLSFIQLDDGTNPIAAYWTLKSGGVYESPYVTGRHTIYAQSAVAGVVLEIQAWT